MEREPASERARESESVLESEWVRRESARANNDRQLLRRRPPRIGFLKIIPTHAYCTRTQRRWFDRKRVSTVCCVTSILVESGYYMHI